MVFVCGFSQPQNLDRMNILNATETFCLGSKGNCFVIASEFSI